MKLRVGIAVPIWKRHELARLTAEWNIKRFERVGCEVVCMLTGSEGEVSRKVADDVGCFYTEAPNEPLGAKANAGFLALRDYEPDFIVSIGSDNLLSRKYVEMILEKMSEGCNVVSSKSCYFYEVRDNSVYYAKGTTGVGAAVNYDHLKKKQYQCFDPLSNPGLDRGFKQRTWQSARHWYVHRSCKDAPIVDIKTGFGLHSMRDMRKIRPLIERTPSKAFFSKHFRGFPLDKVTVIT